MDDGTLMQISENDLPLLFVNVITKTEGEVLEVRSSVNSLSNINWWMEEFSSNTNTAWNVRDSSPEETRKLLCRKEYVCQHSKYKKSKNKSLRNCNCLAYVRIIVKLTTAGTRKKDKYIKEGLPAKILIRLRHTHALYTATALGLLKPEASIRSLFENHFANGLSIKDAISFHEASFDGMGEDCLSNARVNPKRRTVQYWYDEWRKKNFGMRTGKDKYERKRLLPDPEEERSIKRRPKASKPTATVTQPESGTSNTPVETINIKKEPEEDTVIELESSSKPYTSSTTQVGSDPTTLVDNIKTKEEHDEDIAIQLESVLEVENAKIKTEPLSDSEPEPPNLTQEYRSAIPQKCPDPSEDAILGVPQESRGRVPKKCPDPIYNAILGVIQKCPDSFNDANLGVPQESRCGAPQKCSDPSEDVILGVPLDSSCGVPQKCRDPSEGAILGVPQKCSDPSENAIVGVPLDSSCGVPQKCPVPFDGTILVPHVYRDVPKKCSDPSDDASNVQKCPDKSDDAILGVPVEYLPLSCQDVSEKLGHNQLSACGSATLGDIPFHTDQATTSQNAPTLLPMKLVPSAIATPENLSAENPVSERLSDENSMSENLTNENSLSKSQNGEIPMSKSRFDENSMSKSQSDENSVPKNPSDENSMSEKLTNENLMSKSLLNKISKSKNLSDENSMSKSQSDENSMPKSQSDENSMSENLSDKNCASNDREKDEFDLFGEFIAKKLRSMKREKAIQVQAKFGDLLFKLESGELNLQSAKLWIKNVKFQ